MESRDSVFEMPITISYTHPRWLVPFIFITHTGAALCLLPLNLALVWKLVLIMAIICSLFIYLYHYSRDSNQKKSVILRLGSGESWHIFLPAGEYLDAKLVSASIPRPRFVVLKLKGSDHRKYIFILTESSLGKQVLRRLRVRLLHPKA